MAIVEAESDTPTSAVTQNGEKPGFRQGVALIKVYAKRHPKPFVLGVSGAAVFGLATVGSSWAFARLTDEVIRPMFEGARPPVLATFGLFTLMGVIRVVSGVFRRASAAFLRYRNQATWQRMVVQQLIDQPMSFFRRNQTGDLLAAAETDAVASVEMLSPLPFATGVIVLLTAAAGWMMWTDPVLGAIALLLLPFLAFSNHVFQGRINGPAAHVQSELAVLSGSVHEMVDGFGAIKALGLEPNTKQSIHADVDRVADAKISAQKIRVIFETAQEVLLPLVNIVILFVGAIRVNASALSIGQVAGVLSLFNLLVWPLRLLAFMLADIPTSVISARRIESVLSEPVPGPSDRVRVENATFAYELREVTVLHDDGRRALDNITLNIAKHSRVAVVGATGSGKSTLLDVLAGLETPTSGVVRRQFDETATVFQEPVVLSGPLVDSLTLGFDLHPAAIDRALEVAEAGFVDELSSRRATHIGERGITLSGGQRQRVSLARALARQSPVLLLDDTTSSLDAETEERVLRSLRTMGGDQTLVIVTARPSSISFADEIVVLDEGRIVAQGPHEQLIISSPEYRTLFDALTSVGGTQ
jgi:ATP-binding cassette, subfamily B, bacterial